MTRILLFPGLAAKTLNNTSSSILQKEKENKKKNNFQKIFFLHFFFHSVFTVNEIHEEVRESLTVNVTKETELDTFAKLTNLRPMSNYNCRVIAVGHSGSTETSDYVRFETIGIPPEKPTRIAFQILAPTSLQVNWGEPPETNGQIISYLVSYQEVNQDESQAIVIELPSGHQRSLLLEDLKPDIEYLYTVKASNEWGWSEQRRARLAIQMTGSNPPSDYVMGQTSSKSQDSTPGRAYSLEDLHNSQDLPEDAYAVADVQDQIRVKATDGKGHVHIPAPLFGQVASINSNGNREIYGSFTQLNVDIEGDEIKTTEVGDLNYTRKRYSPSEEFKQGVANQGQTQIITTTKTVGNGSKVSLFLIRFCDTYSLSIFLIV